MDCSPSSEQKEVVVEFVDLEVESLGKLEA